MKFFSTKEKLSLIFFTCITLILLMSNLSLASYSTVSMTVVDEPICSIELEENSNFEKRLIEKNLNNKEVTLQLQVTNNEKSSKPTGEIMLVLDNSESMLNTTATGEVRKDLIFDSAQSLVSNLLEDNSQLKIGIVSFSSNTDQSQEGKIEDAQLVSTLNNNAIEVNGAISNLEANGPRTNLQAGLLLASQQFSEEDNNKYMIILTDGVPNLAIDSKIPYYSDTTITQTKNQLHSLQDNGIQIITMLTGIDDEDYTPSGIDKNFGQIIEEIFGTSENPTAGSFYYVTDDKIESTITKDIYSNLLPVEKTLTNIVIKDYFPEEIVDNFDFAYVSDANVGDISAEVNTSDNSITWTIPELASGQTAIVQYTLKLKENFNSNIIDKVLDTNEKVDISYNDFDGTEQSKTSDITPKLKLTEPPAILPKAGTTLLIGLSVLAIGLLIFSLAKILILNNKMKQ